MRVAIIGNMNNNGFSLLRHFKDLSVDATLYIFRSDIEKPLEHFNPVNDTWEYEKWKNSIHVLDIVNNYPSLLKHHRLTRMFRNNKSELDELKEYSHYIGSGLSPAIMNQINIKLDIYYPYSTGIEFVGTKAILQTINNSNYFKRILYSWVRYEQVRGIKCAKYCITPEMSLTHKEFERIGVKPVNMNIPMVYNSELPSEEILENRLKRIVEKFQDESFKIFSHSRQMWINKNGYSENAWRSVSKNNDWIIKAFANINKLSNENLKLFLLEYGPDVNESKELCKKLNIESKVVWLPKMARKEILYLLNLIDVGIGEIKLESGFMLGGTGWEILSQGKPLLQTFGFTRNEYFNIFGTPPPPVIEVNRLGDIEKQILEFIKNEQFRLDYENKVKNWYSKFQGKALASKWLDLLKSD